MAPPILEFRRDVERKYADVYTPHVKTALHALAPLDAERRRLMTARAKRRAQRLARGERITFLDPDSIIAGTTISVRDARNGDFSGGEIPHDLQRQWIQGTGPAAKPHVTLEKSLRNAAYALLSGADGWMFDGEDALGQLSTMSLDNQRNLRLAISRDPEFMSVAAEVAG